MRVWLAVLFSTLLGCASAVDFLGPSAGDAGLSDASVSDGALADAAYHDADAYDGGSDAASDAGIDPTDDAGSDGGAAIEAPAIVWMENDGVRVAVGALDAYPGKVCTLVETDGRLTLYREGFDRVEHNVPSRAADAQLECFADMGSWFDPSWDRAHEAGDSSDSLGEVVLDCADGQCVTAYTGEYEDGQLGWFDDTDLAATVNEAPGYETSSDILLSSSGFTWWASAQYTADGIARGRVVECPQEEAPVDTIVVRGAGNTWIDALAEGERGPVFFGRAEEGVAAGTFGNLVLPHDGDATLFATEPSLFLARPADGGGWRVGGLWLDQGDIASVRAHALVGLEPADDTDVRWAVLISFAGEVELVAPTLAGARVLSFGTPEARTRTMVLLGFDALNRVVASNELDTAPGLEGLSLSFAGASYWDGAHVVARGTAAVGAALFEYRIDTASDTHSRIERLAAAAIVDAHVRSDGRIYVLGQPFLEADLTPPSWLELDGDRYVPRVADGQNIFLAGFDPTP